MGIVSTASIGALGALHCITKELGTSDPLLISHQALPNTTDTMNSYTVDARIQHRSGIASAYIYYRTDTTLPFLSVPMVSLSSTVNHWGGQIPAQLSGTRVYYYVSADAVSGKHQVRPLPAPAGYWKFDVLTPVAIGENIPVEQMLNAFPNPSKGITCIPFNLSDSENINAVLTDVNGKIIYTIYDGVLSKGEQKLFINTEDISAGAYLITIKGEHNVHQQKLMVK